MTVEWKIEGGDTIICNVSDKLTKSDHDKMLNNIGASLKEKTQKLNILVLLENFNGWEEASEWDDTVTSDNNDQFIHKMAIVGDNKWRELVDTFTLQGFRAIPIEYFIEEDTARKWLALD